MKGHSKAKVNSFVKAAAVLALSAGLILTGTSLLPTAALAAEENRAATMYAADYATFEEQQAAAAQLNQDMADEAFILLKNAGDVLPFDVGVKNLSVFGVRSDNLQMGGGGSGSSSSADPTTLAEALTDAGFNLNPKLQAIYARDNNPTVEADVETLAYAQQSYKLYNDAALVVFSRPGSEFSDNKAYNVDGHSDPTDHTLMLQDNEEALLEHVKENFDKVVVIINTPAPLEIAELEDDPDIQGIIWVGLVGDSGISALGRILNGQVNPSGRTTDVWSVNQKKDPTWQNYATNAQTNYTVNADGTVTFEINNQFTRENGSNSGIYQVHYEEGIYMGYRWYETAAADGALTDPAVGYVAADGTIPADKDGDAYYNRSNGVIYPCGYGLSYTDFEWEVVDSNAGAIAKDGKVEFTVRVTNTGDVAGKDVVEIYGTPQYYDGGIEKASVNLIDFAKTDMLRPGQSQDIDFSIDAFDLASFDYNDANGNGFVGYELEAGSYVVSLRKNSHEEVATIDYTVTETADDATAGATGITWAQDPITGADIKAWFSQEDEWNSANDATAGDMAATEQVYTYMTRADFAGIFPAPPTEEEMTIKDWAYNEREDLKSEYSYEDKESDPWYKSEEDIPDDWTQAGEDDGAARKDGKTAIQLWEMSGVPFDDAKWTTFMNQMTYEEMVSAINDGYYRNNAIDPIGKPAVIDQDGPAQLNGGFQTVGIDSIGKSQTWDSDGPAGWVNFVVGFSQRFEGTCTYAAEIVFACSWNTDLLYRFGQTVGDEALTGYTYEEQVTNEDGTTETVIRHIPYTGWYAPAINIHRSAFGGRNWEYYGEDGYLSGKLAAEQIKGLREKGVIPYLKHFAVNEQETTRNAGGLVTWVTEQAMREIYLRPFEIAVKEGKTNGMMSSFNRIGTRWAGGDYRLLTEVLRDEWGFRGAVICDYDSATPYMDNRQMASAGGDLTLGTDQSAFWRDFDAGNAEDVAILRNATKNILYATANSTGVLVSVRTGIAKWQILLYVLDAVIPAGLVVWGVFAIIQAYKKPKEEET